MRAKLPYKKHKVGYIKKRCGCGFILNPWNASAWYDHVRKMHPKKRGDGDEVR